MSSFNSQGGKGLPGFLRRTLRLEDEGGVPNGNGDATIEEVTLKRTSSSGKVPSPIPPPRPVQSPPFHAAPQVPKLTIPTPIQEEKISKKETPKEDVKSEETAPTKPEARKYVVQSPKPVAKPQKLERNVSYKQRQFESTIQADVVSMSELRKLSWNGAPPIHRAQAWKIMLGYVPVNSSRRRTTIDRKRAEYREAIRQHYDIDDDTRTIQEQETLRQVLVDVPRTAPDVGIFRNDRIRRCLSRLLYIWAMRHPASSYVQGINDLATPLIVVFLGDYFPGRDVLDGSIMKEVADEVVEEVEADCYWCLTNLLAGIQDHYTSDQPGVQRMVMRLEELVTRIDTGLTAYLKEVGIEFMQFSFRWMNCLLLREFNIRCVMRLWDTYISEGDGGFEDFHVYVCAAFLCQFSAQLQNMQFDELFGFMQAIPTNDWGDTEVEILLSQAYVLSTLFGGSDAHLTSQR